MNGVGLDARRYSADQERPYIRKIGARWVLSGGRHIGMAGFTTWRGAMDEVIRVAKLYRRGWHQ